MPENITVSSTDILTPEEQALADMFLDAGSEESVPNAARAYLEARRAKEELEARLKTAAEVVSVSEGVLIREMERASVKSLKLEHGGETVNLVQTMMKFYSLPAGSLENADIYQWLIDSGGADLVKSTVHPSTFGAWCRELVDTGKTLHEAIRCGEKKGVQLRKG